MTQSPLEHHSRFPENISHLPRKSRSCVECVPRKYRSILDLVSKKAVEGGTHDLYPVAILLKTWWFCCPEHHLNHLSMVAWKHDKFLKPGVFLFNERSTLNDPWSKHVGPWSFFSFDCESKLRLILFLFSIYDESHHCFESIYIYLWCFNLDSYHYPCKCFLWACKKQAFKEGRPLGLKIVDPGGFAAFSMGIPVDESPQSIGY